MAARILLVALTEIPNLDCDSKRIIAFICLILFPVLFVLPIYMKDLLPGPIDGGAENKSVENAIYIYMVAVVAMYSIMAMLLADENCKWK